MAFMPKPEETAITHKLNNLIGLITLEKLLDRNTRDRALTADLLLQTQWAYTAGKSSKTGW